MKTLLMLLILILVLLVANTETTFAMHPMVTGVVKGQCYPTMQSEYVIIKKHPKGVYEMIGNWMTPHAMVKTKMQFNGAQRINTMFRYEGTKTFPLANGFKAEFDMWSDCL